VWQQIKRNDPKNKLAVKFFPKANAAHLTNKNKNNKSTKQINKQKDSTTNIKQTEINYRTRK